MFVFGGSLEQKNQRSGGVLQLRSKQVRSSNLRCVGIAGIKLISPTSRTDSVNGLAYYLPASGTCCCQARHQKFERKIPLNQLR